jgi:signal peptidase II
VRRLKFFGWLFLVSVVVVIDEVIKKNGLKNFPNESFIDDKKIVNLAIHKNFGIAFDLPVWLPAVTVLTIVIVAALLIYSFKQHRLNTNKAISLAAVAIGALGNLFDRIIYGFTVDYIIIPVTGSAFNLSDVVIIFGIVFLIRKHKK